MSKETAPNWSVYAITLASIKSRGPETEGERDFLCDLCVDILPSFTHVSPKACGCTLLYVQTPFPGVLKQQYAREVVLNAFAPNVTQSS